MKNQYVGDIGDYGKYGLLRFLAGHGIKIGVNWYLTKNDESADGKFTDYLKRPEERIYDPELFDVLQEVAGRPDKTVNMIEQAGIIPGACFFGEYLKSSSLEVHAREMVRRLWFNNSTLLLKDADLIFADPDNGISYRKTAKTKDSQGNAIKNNFTGSAEKDWKIKNRTVTADELGLSENQTYATYFNNTESFDLPDGIVAYIITGVSGTTVTTKRISYIPKNVAVLVENGTSTEDAVDAATDNQLLGTADAKDVSTITGGAVYVLYKSEFVKTTTGTIPANRCYLVVSGGAGARSLSISHGEGNDTGIDNLVFDEDGTEKWYDLRGRRIEKPTKAGLYIRNGEKIVVNDNNK